MKDICIINYGIGSYFSLKNSLKNCDYNTYICDEPCKLEKFNYAILPGVGNYKSASKMILNHGWDKAIREFSKNKTKKIMGICLGFQILFESSEESNEVYKGIGLLKGKISKLIPSNLFRVPHMGWDELNIIKDGEFHKNLSNNFDVYFCHSYALNFKNNNSLNQFQEYTITDHGVNKFISSFRSKNIYGCQFHPEKSSISGKVFWENFCN
tara:strand:+ start:695 stop:1327 length:633 start_codon:yes stop_codon:yes gene_type:complete